MNRKPRREKKATRWAATASLAQEPLLVLLPIGGDYRALRFGFRFGGTERVPEVLRILGSGEDVAIVGFGDGDMPAQFFQVSRGELQGRQTHARSLPFPLLDAILPEDFMCRARLGGAEVAR